MPNYEEGKIYKIYPLVEHPIQDIYIGSTTNKYLSRRMALHRIKYKEYKKGKGGKTTSYDIFDKYGVENCTIELIENVNAKDKNELNSREGFYIRSCPCVNKCIAGRTRKERMEDNKEFIREQTKLYYNKNKEIIQEYKKFYAIENQEKIKEKKQEHYSSNKMEILDKCKLYRQHRSNVINCQCGSEIKEYKMNDHSKTKKHQCYILNNPIPLL